MNPLDPRVWERMAPILDGVLDAPPEDRPRILETACGGDDELRRAVARLVRIGERETGSLTRTAPEVAADLLGSGAAPGPAGYEVRAVLGRGGMGEVYRAFHPTLQREVALKVLPPHLTGSHQARALLIREARAASRLDHPAVQTVYDAGETADGRVYLALALYDGPTLADRIATEGPLPLPEVRALTLQLAEGLDAAHRAGIVHRDVKPANLIVLPDGRLKIVDFGIARVGDATSGEEEPGYGTLSYMSPEHTRAADVGPAADVWSFGVVLYEMLTGTRPFRATPERTLLDAIRDDAPTPIPELRPDAPAPLVTLVERCLRKDPSERPESITEALSPVEGGEDPNRGRRPGRRAATLLLATAVVAVGVVLIETLDFRDQGRGPAGAAGPGAASGTMAVLPFVPVADDSVGHRLGRQLAVTLSTRLDGVGPVRTPEGLVVLSALGGDPVPRAGPAAAEFARRLGAGSYLQGTVGVAAASVRVDLALHDAATGEEIGRTAATGPRDDIAALTDSVALAVLQSLWRTGGVLSPASAGPTTRSLPALQAYLDGEIALAAGNYATAVEAFDSAMKADPDFWYARWRSIYPREYEPTTRLEREQLEELHAHRRELPEPDRRLLETFWAQPVSARLAAQREVTRRFPDYWPGWWTYANTLVHQGPLLGVPLSEAQTALERTLDLHPGFVAASEHLLWVAVERRDLERVRGALAALEEAGTRRSRLAEILPTYRGLVADLERTSDGALASRETFTEEEITERLGRAESRAGPLPPFYFAIDLLLFGACRAQHEVDRRILAREPTRELGDAFEFALALADACTGDWPAGVEALTERNVFLERDVPTGGYGLAVAGAWLGELPPGRAGEHRPATELSEDQDAERLWLDGLLAYALHRPTEVGRARRGLEVHGAEQAPRLARSLAAFETALQGDSAAAGRALAALELEGVEEGEFDRYAGRHPWLTGIHRLAAARWLSAAGDTTAALALLGWEGAASQPVHFLTHPVGRALAPRASLLRARLHAGRGETARAAFHYETVRRTLDPSSESVAWMRREAERFLAGR